MDGHADALSRDERQRLRNIERGLTQDDPDFVTEFEESEPAVGPARRFSQGKYLALLALGIAGIALLTVGLMVASSFVGVAGFAVIVLVLTRLVRDEGTVRRVRSVVGVDSAKSEPPG